jgi:iron complex outermembrane recepter protein
MGEFMKVQNVLFGTILLLALGFLSFHVGAQTTSAAATNDADALQEVVVTGTRIERRGYEAPTPVTVVGDELLVDRAPSTLMDALTELPSMKNVATTGTAGSSVAGTAGESFVNLRGLGANRTLVLVDGVRIVPSNSIGDVDISLLPQSLVSRVDVVTGGASAVYGSDAVAGVANFVLDTKFTGFKGNAEVGETERSDGRNAKVTLTYGTHLSDRLRVLFSADYNRDEGVPPNSRSWANSNGLISNPGYTPTNGQPQALLVPNLYWTSPLNGQINSGPLRGTGFLPNGTPTNYQYCAYAGSSFQACPYADLSSPSSPHYDYLSTPLERGVGYGRVSFDAADNVEVFGDVLLSTSKTSYYSGSPSSFISGVFPIQIDNAFLPESVRASMTQLGLKSFPLSRTFDDFGDSFASRDVTQWRYVTGVNASLWGSWKLHATLEYSRSRNVFELANNAIIGNFRNALDAVVNPANGQTVCRSTLTNPTNGCTPIDPFIQNTPTVQQVNYAMGDTLATLDMKETAGQVAVSGEPFSLWAGPVSLAFDGEYRHESANQTADPLSTAFAFALANPQPLSGSDNVREIAAETVVPLLRDIPAAQSLDLNGAYRYTHYSLSGNISTWKVGLTDDVTKDVRLRATRSRDIRAPSLLELFSGSLQTTGSVIDPFTNQQYSYQAFSTGNAKLEPETADTTSAGIVFHPRWVQGLNLSVDYYNINIKNAISTLTQQDIVNRCFQGDSSLCTLVTRNAAGVITGITSPYLNIASLKTTGVDIDASYRTDLSRFNDKLPGSLLLQILGNYVNEYILSNGAVARDEAGSLSDSQPKWTVNGIFNYKIAAWSLFFNSVYISGGEYSTLYTTPIQLPNNSVKDYWLHNATLQYQIGSDENKAQVVYFAVENLLDTAPPFPFSGGGPGYYDLIGRRFKVGFRFKY